MRMKPPGRTSALTAKPPPQWQPLRGAALLSLQLTSLILIDVYDRSRSSFAGAITRLTHADSAAGQNLHSLNLRSGGAKRLGSSCFLLPRRPKARGPGRLLHWRIQALQQTRYSICPRGVSHPDSKQKHPDLRVRRCCQAMPSQSAF